MSKTSALTLFLLFSLFVTAQQPSAKQAVNWSLPAKHLKDAIEVFRQNPDNKNGIKQLEKLKQ